MGENVELQAAGVNGPDHLLLPATTVEIGGPEAGASVPQRKITIHVHHSGANGIELPVVGILVGALGVFDVPVGEGAG